MKTKLFYLIVTTALLAMFYLMLISDSIVGRFFALVVYTFILTVSIGSWALMEGTKQGRSEGIKANLNELINKEVKS